MTTLSFAIALLLFGLFTLFFLGRRRFLRRGLGGLEQFPSYGIAVFVRLLEAVLRLLAYAALLAGIGLLLVYWFGGLFA